MSGVLDPPFEHELLLCCARARLDRDATLHIQSLVSGTLDWSLFMSAATWHGVLPLAARHLSEAGGSAVPPLVLEALREGSRASALRGLALAGELLSVLDLLSAGGVSGIPFKGPALSSAIYGGPGVRQCGDLDILVLERDMCRAAALLAGRGYQGDLALTDREKVRVLRYGAELVFRRGDVVVELHWRFAPDHFALAWPLGQLFERRTVTRVGARDVASLSNEDLLLALCIHGTKDAWQRLVWLVDVAEIVRAGRVDWTSFLESARAIGARRLALAGLAAASELLGCALPPVVLEAVAADRSVRALTSRIRALLFHHGTARVWGGTEARFHLCARERVADRIRYCIRAAVTPTIEDWRFAGAAARLPGLGHLARPVRLLAKYGGAS